MTTRLTRVLTLLVLFGLTCAGSAFGKDTSKIDHWFGVDVPKGPIERFKVRDLPLKTDGATPEQAKWLKDFELPAEEFECSLQKLSDDEHFTVYRLTYPSQANTPWPENNVVPAEYYIPKRPAKDAAVKRPGAVVLDILDGGAIIPRLLARSAAQNGVVAIYIPMPCYNARRPKGDAHLQYLKEDPHRIVNGIRQTVLDVRRAKAILVTRPEVDPARIGITGVSLGGIMTALCAGVDGEFWRAVPILSGGDVASITFSSHETRGIRELLVAAGIDQKATEAVLAGVEPLHFASRIDPKRCLMINATQDEVIPRATTDALSKAIGEPKMFWVKAGHYSALTFLPIIQQKAVEFLGGTVPEQNEE